MSGTASNTPGNTASDSASPLDTIGDVHAAAILETADGNLFNPDILGALPLNFVVDNVVPLETIGDVGDTGLNANTVQDLLNLGTDAETYTEVMGSNGMINATPDQVLQAVANDGAAIQNDLATYVAEGATLPNNSPAAAVRAPSGSSSTDMAVAINLLHMSGSSTATTSS